MEIWITRDQTGILLEHYASPDEIEGDLAGLEVYPPFKPKENVKVELTGRWEDIKQFFKDIQYLADQVRGMDFAKGSEKDRTICRLIENKLIKE